MNAIDQEVVRSDAELTASIFVAAMPCDDGIELHLRGRTPSELSAILSIAHHTFLVEAGTGNLIGG